MKITKTQLRQIIREEIQNLNEPLPTLKDVVERHNSEVEITEDVRDIAKAKKLVQKLSTIEGKFRKTMYDLDDRLNADPKNHDLSKPLKDSYTKNVTKFMREMMSVVKRMK
jgi:hypothetical protein